MRRSRIAGRLQNRFTGALFLALSLLAVAFTVDAHPVGAQAAQTVSEQLDHAFELYVKDNNYPAGDAAYRAACARPLDPRSFYMAAIGYEGSGQFDLARRYYFRTYYAAPGSQAGQYAVAALLRLDVAIENPEEGAVLITTGPHAVFNDMRLADFVAQEANRQVHIIGSKFPGSGFKSRYVVADNEWPKRKTSTPVAAASTMTSAVRRSPSTYSKRQSPYDSTYGEVSSVTGAPVATKSPGLSATAAKLPSPQDYSSSRFSLDVNGKVVAHPKRP